MNMRETKLRLEDAVAPIAVNTRISPNIITLSSFGVMALAAVFLIRGRIAWAGSFILLSGFLDILDGAVARLTHRETPFGALLDRVSDRGADFTIISAMVMGEFVELRLGLFVLCTVLLASYVSACLEAATATRVGEKLSLRGVRLGVLALACFSGRIQEGMALLALIGTGAVVGRMLTAHRILSPRSKAALH